MTATPIIFKSKCKFNQYTKKNENKFWSAPGIKKDTSN
jgi:hypothetical protein